METVPPGVVTYWNVRAQDGYDQQSGQDAARELWATRVAPLLTRAVGPEARVLDAGCGTGFLARLLAAAGHRVTGQDTSPGMLRVAADRAVEEELAITWSLGPAEAPPDGPFDAVVLRNVLWTLPDPDGALRAWRSALRPGGMLLISDALWGRVDADGDVAHQRFTEHYAEAFEALPLAAGVDLPTCAARVRSAGFDEVVDHTDLFPTAPYPSAPGFFLLSARSGTSTESPDAGASGGG